MVLKILQSWTNKAISSLWRYIHIKVWLVTSGVFISIFLLSGSFNIDLQLRHLTFENYEMSSDIAIVAIDDETLSHYGGWPIDRMEIGNMLASILDQKPRKLAVDMVFQERGSILEDVFLNRILTDPRVVVARSDFPEMLLDEGVLDGVSSASATYPLAPDGRIYRVQTMSSDGLGLSASMALGEYDFPSEFYLNPKTFIPPIFSISDILEKQSLSNILQDKYVFFGSTSQSLSDFYQIPRLNYVPGVAIHALVLNQILQSHFPLPYKLSGMIGLAWLMIVALVLSFRLHSSFPYWLWLEMIVLAGILWLTPLSSVISLSILTSFLGGLIISFAILNVLRLLRDRTHLTQTLKGHFSPTVLKDLLRRHDKLNLGGEKSEITTMFTDLRGFTKFSEEIDPSLVGNVLNEVLGLQADIIIRNDGVVDKFIGDAVMGFWGGSHRRT
jgi:CHASE2 domain-containing sensor protein